MSGLTETVTEFAGMHQPDGSRSRRIGRFDSIDAAAIDIDDIDTGRAIHSQNAPNHDGRVVSYPARGLRDLIHGARHRDLANRQVRRAHHEGDRPCEVDVDNVADRDAGDTDTRTQRHRDRNFRLGEENQRPRGGIQRLELALGGERPAIRDDIGHRRMGGLCRDLRREHEGCHGRSERKPAVAETASKNLREFMEASQVFNRGA